MLSPTRLEHIKKVVICIIFLLTLVYVSVGLSHHLAGRAIYQSYLTSHNSRDFVEVLHYVRKEAAKSPDVDAVKCSGEMLKEGDWHAEGFKCIIVNDFTLLTGQYGKLCGLFFDECYGGYVQKPVYEQFNPEILKGIQNYLTEKKIRGRIGILIGLHEGTKPYSLPFLGEDFYVKNVELKTLLIK